jgi:2-dehydropantoate 2-reductase
MRFIMVGAGGVGGLIGGLLQRSGQEVAFLARGRQLQALREGGLHVQSPRGTFHLARVEASDDPAELPPGDVVLVATKGWQVPEVAPHLVQLLRPDGLAVPLENGVEAAGHLTAALGEARVAGGLCFLLSRVEAPGHIHHLGEALRVTVGERAGGTSSPRLEALCSALRAAQVDAEVAPDIDVALWDKLLFIEPFGAVGAVTRAPAGVFRSRRESRELLVSAMDEVATLARARGVSLPADAVARALQIMDRLPAEATASMQRDIMSARPSELGDQTGAVLRLARAAALAVPVHAFLWAALLPQEDAARRQEPPPLPPGIR